MKKRLYLSTEEITKLLNILNEKSYHESSQSEYSVQEIEEIIIEAYRYDDNSKDALRRHSYSDISEYVKKTQELDILFTNLNSFLDAQEKIVNQNIIIIVYKIRDHLNLEDTRRGHEENIKNTYKKLEKESQKNKENLKKIDEVSQKYLQENKKNLEKINEVSQRNEENLAKIKRGKRKE